MDSILPPAHFLKSKLLRYFIYTIAYGLLTILPAPVLYASMAYENQYELKQDLMQSVQVYLEDFMSDCVLVASLGGSNPIIIGVACIGMALCCSGVAIVLLCSYVIWRLTSKVGIIGSVRYKAQQRQLFLSLVIMVNFEN